MAAIPRPPHLHRPKYGHLLPQTCPTAAAAVLLILAVNAVLAPSLVTSSKAAWLGDVLRQRPLQHFSSYIVRRSGAGRVADRCSAVKEALTKKKERKAKRQHAAEIWRKHSADWGPAPEVLSDGKPYVPNLKHGPNPLYMEKSEFPKYSEIHPEHIDRGIMELKKVKSREVQLLLQNNPEKSPYTFWEHVMHPLEILTDRVDKQYDTVLFIKDVVDNSPKMRKACKNFQLWRWWGKLEERTAHMLIPHFKRLLSRDGQNNEAKRRAAAFQLMELEFGGVNLQEWGWSRNATYAEDITDWHHYQKARNNLFKLMHTWNENIEEDMNRKSFLVRHREELEGLPKFVLQDAADAALQAGYRKATAEDGPWKITLDDAMLEPILSHASGRSFREFVYGARARVGFLGGSGPGDNTVNLETMLKERKTFANLLGYTSWGHMIYTRRMATLDQAYAFLARLRREIRPKARTELFELQQVARSQGADYKLDFFDLHYWRERLVEKRFSLSTEYVREFFQLPNVLDGLFGLLRRLFGVEIVAADGDADVWDPHVRFFRVREADTGELIASFFLDLHRRRAKKKPGFWYAKIQDYSIVLGTERLGPRLPAAHIVCDFAPPDSSGKPTLLTHEDVRKLFHTMGGALRHLLCNQWEGLVAGTSGLELDAVAIPAFFLERWAYDPTTLRSMAQHVDTHEPLPEPAIEMIAATRTFHRALGLLKRTTLAQIDLDLHAQYDPDGELPIFDVVKLIEEDFAVIPPRVKDREFCSAPISGEFGGASLVADLWAEALAADVLTEFEAEGFDDQRAVARLGQKFRRTVLAPGGGRSPVSALREFLGRQSAFAAFLQHMGLEGQGIDHFKSQAEDEYDDVNEEDDDYMEFEEEEMEDKEHSTLESV